MTRRCWVAWTLCVCVALGSLGCAEQVLDNLAVQADASGTDGATPYPVKSDSRTSHPVVAADGASEAGAFEAGIPEASVPDMLFRFDTDLEGWIAGASGGAYDQAEYIATIGNPGGSLLLNGSDFGISEGEVNAWFERKIPIQKGAKILSFDTRAQNDAALRLRLVDSSDSYELLSWQVLSGGDWVSVSVDVSAWAGQSVTLFFEQDDDGEGVGEYRYVDNVRIGD